MLKRRALLFLLLVVLGFTASRLLLQGLVLPIRVASGSMANALLGAHVEQRCGSCQIPFAWGIEVSPQTSRITCPNCGYVETVDSDTVGSEWQARYRSTAGDRVLIDRASRLFRSPRRWEVVAFRERGQLVVKRIVGLPGERIEFRDGDIFVDGEIAQKSLDQIWQTAVLVHDDRFRPTDRPGQSRWQSDHNRWQVVDDGYELLNGGHDAPLGYVHWPCLPPPTPRTIAVPISDNYGYNQNRSRDLHPVRDLIVAFNATWSGAGSIAVRFDHVGPLGVHVDTENGQVRLADQSSATASKTCPSLAHNEAALFVVAVVDQRLLIAVDGHELMSAAAGAGPLRDAMHAVSISAEGFEQLTIRELRLWRDVYYLPPTADEANGIGLSLAEFFVLGDNSPVSIDSRSEGPVPYRDIVGRAVPQATMRTLPR